MSTTSHFFMHKSIQSVTLIGGYQAMSWKGWLDASRILGKYIFFLKLVRLFVQNKNEKKLSDVI